MYLSQHISNTFSWLHLLGVNSYIQVLIAPNDHRFFCYDSPILSVNNSLRALQYVYKGDNVQTTYFNNAIASSCTTDLTPFFQRYSTEECSGGWRQWTTFLTINSHAVTYVLGSCNQYNHCNHAWSTTTATMHAVQPPQPVQPLQPVGQILPPQLYCNLYNHHYQYNWLQTHLITYSFIPWSLQREVTGKTLLELGKRKHCRSLFFYYTCFISTFYQLRCGVPLYSVYVLDFFH